MEFSRVGSPAPQQPIIHHAFGGTLEEAQAQFGLSVLFDEMSRTTGGSTTEEEFLAAAMRIYGSHCRSKAN